MLDELLSLDQKLLVFLNTSCSETYDPLWLFITKQANWTPFFILLLYIVFKKLGTRQTLYLILFVTILLFTTDLITNFFKNEVQRLRPCNNKEINSILRIVHYRDSFSFFSGHATNSMGVASFLYLIFKKDIKYFWLIFLWPLIFAYSRIHLALHYPLDIICGYLCGAICGFLMYKIYCFMQKKYFPLESTK